jgi:hypothetical protein
MRKIIASIAVLTLALVGGSAALAQQTVISPQAEILLCKVDGVQFKGPGTMQPIDGNYTGVRDLGNSVQVQVGDPDQIPPLFLPITQRRGKWLLTAHATSDDPKYRNSSTNLLIANFPEYDGLTMVLTFGSNPGITYKGRCKVN